MLLNYVIIISFLQVAKLRLMKTFVKGHTRYKVVELNSKPGLCGSWTGLELMSVGPAWAEREGQGRQSTFLACWVSSWWGGVDLWLKKWVGAQFSLSEILMSISWVTLHRSLSRWMDKGDEVHLYNGVLLSHKKEWNRNFPGEPVVKTLPPNIGCVCSSPGQGATCLMAKKPKP